MHVQVLILEIAVACIVKTETRSTSMAYLGLFSGCVALFNSTMNKTAQHWLPKMWVISQEKISKLVVLLYVGLHWKKLFHFKKKKHLWVQLLLLHCQPPDSVSPLVVLSAFPANLFFFVLIVSYILLFKMHLHCIGIAISSSLYYSLVRCFTCVWTNRNTYPLLSRFFCFLQ